MRSSAGVRSGVAGGVVASVGVRRVHVGERCCMGRATDQDVQMETNVLLLAQGGAFSRYVREISVGATCGTLFETQRAKRWYRRRGQRKSITEWRRPRRMCFPPSHVSVYLIFKQEPDRREDGLGGTSKAVCSHDSDSPPTTSLLNQSRCFRVLVFGHG